MWHRLAKALGKSVRQCQAEVDSAEFSSWIAYYHLEPFGDQWEDYRFGVLCAAVRNCWRGEGTEPFQPPDFFHTLRDRNPKPELSLAERIRAAMEQVTDQIHLRDKLQARP